MRKPLPFLLCLLAIASPSIGVIVDRTAITVGIKVITESEIIRRIRLQAFQMGALPEFSERLRREAAQRLIDLKLVEREMDLGHYARTPPDKAKALVDAFTAEHFRSSPEALRLALASMDLTPADLQAELAEQVDLLSFTDLRFGPAVEVTEQQIEAYYHSKIEPGNASKAPADQVTFSAARAGIEQTLASERADQDLDAWLKDQRARTKITYLEKELR